MSMHYCAYRKPRDLEELKIITTTIVLNTLLFYCVVYSFQAFIQDFFLGGRTIDYNKNAPTPMIHYNSLGIMGKENEFRGGGYPRFPPPCMKPWLSLLAIRTASPAPPIYPSAPYPLSSPVPWRSCL